MDFVMFLSEGYLLAVFSFEIVQNWSRIDRGWSQTPRRDFWRISLGNQWFQTKEHQKLMKRPRV